MAELRTQIGRNVMNPWPRARERLLDPIMRQANRFDQLDRVIAAAAECRVVDEFRHLAAGPEILQRHVLDQEERTCAKLLD
ncbi:MAG TPA: hypothetical protein VNS60_03200 [Solirubrobacterales bacterium]|nr:hypothetical protein [Solirubrobacterales bacterium]